MHAVPPDSQNVRTLIGNVSEVHREQRVAYSPHP